MQNPCYSYEHFSFFHLCFLKKFHLQGSLGRRIARVIFQGQPWSLASSEKRSIQGHSKVRNRSRTNIEARSRRGCVRNSLFSSPFKAEERDRRATLFALDVCAGFEAWLIVVGIPLFYFFPLSLTRGCISPCDVCAFVSFFCFVNPV